VVIVAAKDAVFIDRDLEDVVGCLFVAWNKGKDADGFPFLSRRCVGRLSLFGNRRRLLRELLRSSDVSAVVVDGVFHECDVVAVVIANRSTGKAGVKTGEVSPSEESPGVPIAPTVWIPAAGMSSPPRRVKTVIIAEAVANIAGAVRDGAMRPVGGR